MGIRAKIRVQAQDDLNKLVEQIEQVAIDMCGDKPLEPKDLLRIAADDRKTARKRAITALADVAEARLLEMLD